MCFRQRERGGAEEREEEKKYCISFKTLKNRINVTRDRIVQYLSPIFWKIYEWQFVLKLLSEFSLHCCLYVCDINIASNKSLAPKYCFSQSPFVFQT